MTPHILDRWLTLWITLAVGALFGFVAGCLATGG
jgi:hypothetical protein